MKYQQCKKYRQEHQIKPPVMIDLHQFLFYITFWHPTNSILSFWVLHHVHQPPSDANLAHKKSCNKIQFFPPKICALPALWWNNFPVQEYIFYKCKLFYVTQTSHINFSYAPWKFDIWQLFCCQCSAFMQPATEFSALQEVHL